MPSGGDDARRGPGSDARNSSELTTPRLHLSFGTAADAAVIFPLVHGEPGRAVTRFLLWDGPDDPGQLAEFFRLHTEGTFVPHGFHWLLRDRTGAITGEAGRAMGSIGITDPGVPGRGELGYWLGEPWWGRGLMREAIVAVVEHAFGPLRMAKVEALPFASNERSLALLEGLGFSREGRLRRHFRKGGRRVDAVMCGLLPGELRADR